MATNLLVANCGIPLAGTHLSGSTEDPNYPASNLFGGDKADYFQLASATTGTTTVAVSPGSSQAADFLYVARADLLQASGVTTVALKGNSTNTYGTATTVYSDASFSSASLVGPNGDDYLATFAASSSYPYWYVDFASASATRRPCSKVFFGRAFDPGRDPDGEPSGEVVVTRTRPTGKRKRPLYTLEISWQGLAQPKAVEMYQRFALNRRRDPAILFTTSYHEVLSGHRVLFGRVLEMTFPPRATDFCDVKMTWEELL